MVQEPPTPTRALEGIRVLEFGAYVTGPMVGMILADLGADVVKVEPPGSGDAFRRWGASMYSPTFRGLNRNKRSLALDLRRPDAGRVVAELVRATDVAIVNMRPGVPARLGISYEQLSAINERLVYCSITAFGEQGPYASRPGYDTIGQALSGLMGMLIDAEDGKPVGVSLSDHVTGLFAACGVLAGLAAREHTRRGQLVTTSLLQSSIAFIGENAARFLANGDVPRRESRLRLAQVHVFVAGDGLPFAVHLSSPEKFWRALVGAVNRPELTEDPRFRDRQARAEHYDQLHGLLADVFTGDTRDAWLQRLQAADVPCAPINALDEVFQDPQVKVLDPIWSIEHPEEGPVRVARTGFDLSATPPALHRPPPTLGEHTLEVLSEAGFTTESIGELRQSGAVAYEEIDSYGSRTLRDRRRRRQQDR